MFVPVVVIVRSCHLATPQSDLFGRPLAVDRRDHLERVAQLRNVSVLTVLVAGHRLTGTAVLSNLATRWSGSPALSIDAVESVF
jgi:hypothetical protein